MQRKDEKQGNPHGSRLGISAKIRTLSHRNICGEPLFARLMPWALVLPKLPIESRMARWTRGGGVVGEKGTAGDQSRLMAK